MSPQDNSFISLSQALRQVLARPQLELELKSEQTRPQTIEKLKINEDIATEIINILMDLNGFRPSGTAETTKTKGEQETNSETDREFLFESFHQLRTAYRTAMTMSVVMFILGVTFLVIAAIRSFTDPQSIVMTSVIGGIGVVQVVALFYRNPLVHITQTVSNTQQAKMAVMSYLLGISLLNQQLEAGAPTEAHMENLIHLTETALQQFQNYVEGSPARIRPSGIKSSEQNAGKNKES